MSVAIEYPPCRRSEGIAPPALRYEGADILIDVGFGTVAVVDAGDYEIAASKRWRIYEGSRYAYAYDGKRKVYLHRVIAKAPDGMAVDHIDGDTFNDRRANLRVVTAAQNSQNLTRIRAASGIRGVRVTPSGMFEARVKVDRREHRLGTFATAEMAKAVAEEGRRQLMTHSAENLETCPRTTVNDLSTYLSENCFLCERRSRWGLHKSCVVLTYLTATDGWVSLEALRDAVGRSDSWKADLEQIHSAIRPLRHQGWLIQNGPSGYRLEGRKTEARNDC